ncbi:MAG: RICIN domain-containing protein [Capsulimonas sp.]|uniref:RICIN domain-containing protein n=1 Tax=Capsulimonas sp. TaxID=2494211 RepID=UPI0032670BED
MNTRSTRKKMTSHWTKRIGFAALLGLSITLAGAPGAHAQNSANADTVYNGWLNAYLIRSGGQTYFCNSLTDRSRAFMWGQAYMITGVEDAYDKNKAADRKQLVTDLLNTFIANEITPDTNKNLAWDSWNDDLAWAIIALIRGYQITGNTAYRDAAVTNWNVVYNRGWDNTFGGGIWENMDNVPAGGKGGLSNWPMVIAGGLIYDSTGDATILSKSQSIYAWARSHAYDPNNGRVYEGWNSTGIYGDDNAYNSGLLVNSANALYKITRTTQYYNDAVTAAAHVINKYPILNEDHPANGDFGGDQFYRGLSLFARQNNLWNTYWQWLENNAASAWNNRRTDSNVSWNNFTSPTTTGNLRAMEAEGSVVVQAVSQINPISGVHTIFNQANGLVIDNASTNTQGAGVIQWGWNSGSAQKWIFTQNSDSSWSIVNKYSGQGLDNANSTSNGTQIIQWGASSGNNNQRWWVDQQSDGSYKIWNKANSLALDNNNMNTNAASLIQWGWNGGANQRWYLK